MSNTSIIQHIEDYLGPISQGWANDHDAPGVSVIYFEDQPFKDVTTFSTLGLSNHILKSESDQVFREELLFSTYNTVPYYGTAQLLHYIVEQQLSNHKAILRGEVIELDYPVCPGSSLVGLYASSPVVFKEGIHVYYGSDPPSVFVWMIPITEQEIIFRYKNGWRKFEEILEAKNPDLIDFNRSSVV